MYNGLVDLTKFFPEEIDEHGFWMNQWYHWVPETRELEAKRLRFNQALYIGVIKNGGRWPEEINERLGKEFSRLEEL